MKTNILKGIISLLAGSMLLVSCTEKKAEEPKAPVFPEKQVVELNVDETKSLSFTAEDAWSLSVDKSFVRFIDGGTEKNIVSGEAGSNTVEVIMKGDGQGFDTSDKASVTMKMGTGSAVIFEIMRPQKERVATVFVIDESNGEARPAEKLNITYNQYNRLNTCKIGVEANFDWYVESCPDWLEELELSGKAGEAAVMTAVRVLNEQKPYSHMDEDKIVISSEDHKYSIEFPVTYTGLPDGIVTFDPSRIVRTGVTFNEEGYVMSSSGEGLVAEDYKEESFNVQTLDYEYDIAIVEYNGSSCEIIDAAQSWLNVVEDKENHGITLSVKEDAGSAAGDRVAYLYVFPPKYSAADYDFSQDFEDGRFANTGKIAVPVTLLGKKAVGGFYIDKYKSTWPMETYKEYQAEYAYTPELAEQFGTDNIHRLVLEEEDFSIPEGVQAKQVRFRVFPVGFDNSMAVYNAGLPLASWFLDGKKPGYAAPSGDMGAHTSLVLADMKPFAEIPEGDVYLQLSELDANYEPTGNVAVLILTKK